MPIVFSCAPPYPMMVVSIKSTNRLFQRTGHSEEIDSGSRLFKDFRLIATCANPACAVPFLYWRGGKLFRFDVKSPGDLGRDVSHHIGEQKPNTNSVFFWLCESCCPLMGLRFDQHEGLAIVPLSSSRHGTSSIVVPTDAQELSA